MKITVSVVMLLFTVSSGFADAFYSAAMLQGRYNVVSFGNDHGTEFSSGIGYVVFDGISEYTGQIEQVTHSQTTGDAFDVGPLSGTYAVSDQGKIVLNGMDTGFVSADGTMVVLAPVPGDVPYEETGITVAVREGAGMSAATLKGTYQWVSYQCENTTCFESELGTAVFDGVSQVTGTYQDLMFCRGGGVYESAGRFSEDYAVTADGKLTSSVGGYTGFVSPDGSLFVFAPITDQVQYERTGITVGVRQGSGLSAGSIETRYNAVVFGSDHASEFSAGVGHVTFDGRSRYHAELTDAGHSQSPETAFEAGISSGRYTVSKKGQFSLNRQDTGFVSADGAVILWVPVPGDTAYEEGGITIALRQVTERTGQLDITRATVKAGIKTNSDSIQLLGRLDAAEPEILTAHAIIVSLDADAIADTDLTTWTFPVDEAAFQNGRYNFSRRDNASQDFFKYDPKNGRMQFSAKNVDLTGLACPMTVTVTIGAYSAQVDLDENIVNGTRKPCPPELMMGLADSLIVDRATVRFGRTPESDTLTVQGFFTIAGDYDKANNLIASLGKKSFTVSGDQFNARGTAVTCNRGACDEGPRMKARFDFAKCTYRITITGTTIDPYGVVPFGIDVFGNALGGAVIDLGPKRVYQFENELRYYNELSSTWAYTSGYSVEVGSAMMDVNGRLCSFTTGDNADSYARSYWFNDDTGTYLKRWNAAMKRDAFALEMDIDTDLLVAPLLVSPGMRHTAAGTFAGDMDIDMPDFDVTVRNLAGKIDTTLRVIRWEQVRVTAGRFMALRMDQTYRIKGGMDIELRDLYAGDDLDTTGTVAMSMTTRSWYVPEIGIVKSDESVTIRLTARRGGTLSDRYRDTFELIDYH